ncbi:MAG: DUF1272 domain-containing protein [Alphaproteobacteria bacterium]|nr:DUF1272 domain-containing protein [Alphaproteobacteria bacterium]
MLDLRPNCECCDRDLPNGAVDALICTFECTFCADCASTHFGGRCPNCGGDLVRRPTRPEKALARFPASTTRVRKDHPTCRSVA